MESRNFQNDLNNSNNPELRKSWEKMFKRKFGDDIEIIWQDEKNVQLGFGTDITIKTKKGRRYSIEVKTRKNSVYKDDRWIMEIVHHIYDREEQPRTYLSSKEGWIYTTTAEYIFHGTLNENGTDLIEVIFYSLNPFKNTQYKSEYQKYENMWWPTTFTNGNFQLTLNKLMPKDIIKRESLEFWEWER